MNRIVSGYAAKEADGPLVPFAFQRRTLRPDDVQLEILYCGVCHTDLHQVRNHWDGRELAAAAPLMCTGITTYSPLRHFGVGPGAHVGVIGLGGLGGLGHMAVKLAAAMACEVTLFTRSPGKVEEARRLGAHRAVVSTDASQMKSTRNQLDLILDTVPQPHSLAGYLTALRRNGNLVLVGPLGPMDPPIELGMLMSGRKSLSGSAIGGMAETQEMLDFCAQRNITCEVERIDIQEINRAYERMQADDVRYRFVIDMASLTRPEERAATGD